jgi:hypothetical protein
MNEICRCFVIRKADFEDLVFETDFAVDVSLPSGKVREVTPFLILMLQFTFHRSSEMFKRK